MFVCVIMCGEVSEKLDVNQHEIKTSLTARDEWSNEKTELMKQLAEVQLPCAICN